MLKVYPEKSIKMREQLYNYEAFKATKPVTPPPSRASTPSSTESSCEPRKQVVKYRFLGEA